ncbi:laminin subunit beta-4 isoform X2 [Solea solea]|uniref:laminin subunit beta-4 isoform X2 n=1 Tax=Solea solea TaxID=90069 RepID=UPI00272BC442|nr:laminin subunit beta-4 isoform X2 [Solea solea]
MIMIFIFIILLPVTQLQIIPELHKLQDPQELQDPQGLQGLHDPQWLQELQNPQWLQELQDHQWLQELPGPQQLQDLQELQEFQKLQNPQDIQELQWLQDPQELQDQCSSGFCRPQLGDLMIGRASHLSTSSTCGLEQPHHYCIIGYLEEVQKCFTCDSRLPYDRYNNQNSHRIKNVITTFDPERKMQWWQSENGVHHVSIQLDLETVFQFSHMVLTFKSFRPAAMLVERSKDFGRTWKVLRYFADDCSLHFPSVSSESADRVDDIICDSRYSGPEPSTDGEVVLKALDPIFEIQSPYAPNIQDLITLTNIRVNFTRLFTLGDTLLSRKRRDPENKYYYALYNMVVQGSCFCHGHASHCMPVDARHTHTGMIHGQCVCQHNTAGENCDRCQEFHHDSPWRPGEGHTADVCRRCNCHGHSHSCHFDAARFEATGGASGGVCDNCLNERTGPQCERCSPFLYRDPQKAVEDPYACIPCDCDTDGSLGDGLCDGLTGQCVCKQNVEGQRCDRCKHGFFGLSPDNAAGCQACRCHPLGSVGSCDQLTGSCECEHLASGPLCDQCVTGYWGLGTSVFRCSPCDCDVGGALSSTCPPDDGQCHCLPNMIGRRCSDPAPGYFLPSLDYFLYEAEFAAPLLEGSSPTKTPSSFLVNPQCEEYFRNQGFHFKISNGRIVLVQRSHGFVRRRRQQSSIPSDTDHTVQVVARQRPTNQEVTWTGLGLVRVLEGAGLRFTVDNLPSSMDYQLVIRYEPETPSDWLASVSIMMLSPGDHGCSSEPTGSERVILSGNSRTSLLDSTVCLSAGAVYFVDVVFQKQSGSDGSFILIDSIGLVPRIESVQNFCSQTHLESFRRCVGLAAELDPQVSLPELCEGLIKSMSAHIHHGAVVCRCDLIGSVGPSCSKLGGFCKCKPNVIGRCCDTCAPLTFGFGPDGCKPCQCDTRGSVAPLCDQVRGQCACRSEVTGQHCDRCRAGFWGFPLCRLCDCNGLSEECDDGTGQCRNCRENTAGPQCDRCVDGYYGNPASRQTCEPCLCPDIRGSGRFFATSCQHDPQSISLMCNCREGHTGSRCDRCAPGYYGDLTLPKISCEECHCNNNINPEDRDACDTLTGECLRCLHNTMGTSCQSCKPGYYGNALVQDCKECSCDRRGTKVIHCPLGSSCFCDERTGQCPCRTGVMGVLCDTCEDGYWNLDGSSGCQPCGCDPVNSASIICNKVTGQCPCLPEFGGRQCDECGENHFGNPDLQCISCECNLEGTERPSCDPETGECLCRAGATGILCDECASGNMSAFPVCEECHPCTAIWADSVTDVQRAAQRMMTLIPRYDGDLQPRVSRQQQWTLQMHLMLDSLANLTGLSQQKVKKAEKICVKIGKLREAVDPNRILIDPSSLLNTEIDNIRWEFNKLLKNLKERLIEDPDDDDEDVEKLRDETQELLKNVLLDENRVNVARKALEVSVETRQEVDHKLSQCRDLTPLEKMIKELSVVTLNRQVCGGSGLDNCSGCGGALCILTLGRRKCGGPSCDGVVPASQTALEITKRAKKQLTSLTPGLEESRTKIHKANQAAQATKNQAKDSREKIHDRLDSLERENKTRELIQRAKDYLTDESVPPEDIEKMAQAVLDIQLRQSPAHIQSMISEINRLSNMSMLQKDLKNLDEYEQTSQSLLEKAQELKENTKDIDVTDIRRDIYDAETAQDKANDDLDTASRDRHSTKDRIQHIKDKLNKVDMKVIKSRPEDLKNEISFLKKKNEENRESARNARDAAETALNATDTQMELEDVMKMFQLLKQKNSTQALHGEAGERVKNIIKEAEDVNRQVQDKFVQLRGLDEKIQLLIKRKDQKVTEVSDLLKTAESLRQEISQRAEEYADCTS